MHLLRKASKVLAVASLAATLMVAVQPAQASHEQFQNVQAQGGGLTPTQDNGAFVNNITSIGNTVTFTLDYHSNGGTFGDNLNFTFSQTGGTAPNPPTVAVPVTFAPGTQSLFESFTFNGTYQGGLHIQTNNSFPDYSSPANGYNFSGADFNLNVIPGSGAVPEPSQTATLGFGILGLAGLLLAARKRKANAIS